MTLTLAIALLVGIDGDSAPGADPSCYVGAISFDQIAGLADLVVVAKVERVVPAPDRSEDELWPLKLAHATALESWKGIAERDVVFRASGSWTCDTSSATEGETRLLFLGPIEADGYRSILDAGRGAMPVSTLDSDAYATVWTEDVMLPPDVATRPGPDAHCDFIRNVRLEQLRKLTREIAERRLTLDDLVSKSDLVVIAIFDRIPKHTGRRHASVDLQIVETWKGKAPGDRVELRVSPSWPLDVIYYEVGQKQLLFLSKPLPDGSRDILEAGRGRMTIERVGERLLGVAWVRDVTYPRELRTDEAPDKKGLLFGRVDLEGVKKFVEKVGK